MDPLSYVRIQADMPNETWQSDFTHYRLTDGTDTEIITWLDDHSRYALHIKPQPRTLLNRQAKKRSHPHGCQAESSLRTQSYLRSG